MRRWEALCTELTLLCVVLDSCDATISTATSHIVGPPEDIKKINDYLFSRSSKKPKRTSTSCTDRVYSIVEESFRKRDNGASAEEVFKSSQSDMCENL